MDELAMDHSGHVSSRSFDGGRRRYRSISALVTRRGTGADLSHGFVSLVRARQSFKEKPALQDRSMAGDTIAHRLCSHAFVFVVRFYLSRADAWRGRHPRQVRFGGSNENVELYHVSADGAQPAALSHSARPEAAKRCVWPSNAFGPQRAKILRDMRSTPSRA